jgi:hypothetical protein
MITLEWWKFAGALLLVFLLGMYVAGMIRHIRTMTNEYDGGEP